MSPVWQHRDGSFDTSKRTLVMGVLNVTPDSFSDGGRFVSIGDAVARGRVMLAEGADIVDIGGESTRPGSLPVPEAEELERVIPVVKALAGEAVVSIDTSKAVVADAALNAGACIVNDISGLGDPQMIEVVRRHRAGLVIMHMQGTPQTMQQGPVYHDVVTEVGDFLRQRMALAVADGILPGQIVVDPGIGFGKELDHNLALLRSIDRIATATGRPVLAGVSRKRFIGAITGREIPDRLAGSLAAAAFAIGRGARILRVHDVKESCDVVRMIDKLNK